MRMQVPKKLIELEALRGLAAVVVLFHHFMLGFTPRLHGMLYPEQPYSLFGTPAFAFVNGSAAVIVFFVLSGSCSRSAF
jgi:peptidoglycan/LPS O-acetylase OafA/YrhL